VGLGYLGPAGTFTHQASLRFEPRFGDPVALATVDDVFAFVAESSSRAGVVPIENSIGGLVATTLDAWLFEYEGLIAVAETVVPVSFDAFVAPGVGGSVVRTVMSHPQGLAQCRRFIKSHGAEPTDAASTADACRIVAESGEEGLVALASTLAGERYRLRPIATSVEDLAGAATRFLVIGHDTPQPTGDDRTMLAVYGGDGDVVTGVAAVFSSRRQPIFRLDLRPRRTRLGEYVAVVTTSGHPTDSLLASAISELAETTSVRILGSYPRFRESIPNAEGPPVLAGEPWGAED